MTLNYSLWVPLWDPNGYKHNPQKIILQKKKNDQLFVYIICWFQLNSNLESIDLTGNDIGSEGTNYLCQCLAENVFITELVNLFYIFTEFS